ncbi:MAG: coproporphyrinogen III oxidase, partial [Nitratireductor sp.]
MQRPEIPADMPDGIEDKKETARTWFESLRDRICTDFEPLEDALT